MICVSWPNVTLSFPAASWSEELCAGSGWWRSWTRRKNRWIWHLSDWTVTVQHILTINSYVYYVPQQTDNMSTSMKIHLFLLFVKRKNKVHNPQHNTGRIQSGMKTLACAPCDSLPGHVRMTRRGSDSRHHPVMHRQVSEWTSLGYSYSTYHYLPN